MTTIIVQQGGDTPPTYVPGDVKPPDPPGCVYVRTVAPTTGQHGWTLMLRGGPYDGEYPHIRLSATELKYEYHPEGRYLPTGRLVPTVMGNAKEIWEWQPATSLQGADDAEGTSSAGDVGEAQGAVEDV